MRKIALLSMDCLDDFVCYDDLLISPFKDAGFDARFVSWRADVNWNDFDAVIVRSTWDYQDEPELFMTVLKEIDESRANLFNSLNIMQWNVDKRYLKSLEEQGVIIVPSIFMEHCDLAIYQDAFVDYKCKEVVIKPCISANADDTYRLDLEALITRQEYLSTVFENKPHIIQPFIPSIVERGEYSIFYFGGKYSHAILKTPKAGDFRVQEEHGGQLQSINPDDVILDVCNNIIQALPEIPLYIRVDLVNYQNAWCLMEVELIEPSLYFNLDEQSAQRFVDAFLLT